MGRIVVDVDLANNFDVRKSEEGSLQETMVRRIRVSGVVDSGASYLVVPEKVVKALGVPAAGRATVRYADRRRASRDVVEDVRVELLGRHGTFKAIVEPRRTDVLIGAIVLEDLDLLVDCRTQTLRPRDPKQFVAEIE
jgi:clan AA aspartic protease